MSAAKREAGSAAARAVDDPGKLETARQLRNEGKTLNETGKRQRPIPDSGLSGNYVPEVASEAA